MTNEPTIGHNNPPSDSELPTTKLQEGNELLLTHADQLIAACERVPEPQSVEDAGKITDFIKQINTAKKKIEERHTAEKAPFLTFGRLVDNFFKPKVTALDVAKAKPTKLLNAWHDKVAKEEADRRAAEAKRLREEADKKAADAAALEGADMTKEANKTLSAGIKAEAQAERFEQSVASGRGLSAARGSEGATSSQRKTWTAEITDPNAIDLNALRAFIPAAALQQAVNGFMRAGGRELAGVRIYEKTETVVR